jgi:hypothetical protein
LLVVGLLVQLTALSQLIVMGWELGVLKAQLLPSWKPLHDEQNSDLQNQKQCCLVLLIHSHNPIPSYTATVGQSCWLALA